MYSFMPTPPVDTINDHTGFFCLLIFMIIVAYAVILYCVVECKSVFGHLVTFVVIPIMIGYHVSWTTGEIKTFKNEQVIGQFVGFTAEWHNENRSSGKTTTVVTVRNQYVDYLVNGEHVLLPATLGVPYPKSVVLYKN
jgi:hypothetical protein